MSDSLKPEARSPKPRRKPVRSVTANWQLATDNYSPDDIAAAELHADRCVCQRAKRDGDPFCALHMNKLPAGIRARLRVLSFGAGYVPVYIQARELVLGAGKERTA